MTKKTLMSNIKDYDIFGLFRYDTISLPFDSFIEKMNEAKQKILEEYPEATEFTVEVDENSCLDYVLCIWYKRDETDEEYDYRLEQENSKRKQKQKRLKSLKNQVKKLEKELGE